MKKILKILTLLVIIASSKINVFAAPADADGWQVDPYKTIIDTIESNYSITIGDAQREQIWLQGFNPQDNYFLFITEDSSYLHFNFYKTATLNEAQTVLTMQNPGFAYNYEKRNGAMTPYSTSNWTRTLQAGDQIVGYYLDLIQGDPEIDYSIPVPDARMVTLNNSGVNWNEEPVNNFGLQIKTPNIDLTNLNVEVIVKYYTPSKVYLNTYMWNQTEYNVAEYLQSPQDNVISLASRTRLIDLPVNTNAEYRWQVDLDSNNGWANFYNANVTAGVPDFYWAASGDEVTQGEALMAIGKFTSKQPYLPSAFNICEVFVRYYRVVDSNIKLGQWLHLKNDTVVDNESLNVNMPVFNPPISQNTDDNIDLPGNENSIGTGVWFPSSPQDAVNVIVNNNMPQQNTLNYPTITSYNHDQIFTKWAENARQIPSFFDGIVAFGQMAFAFVPEEIWIIIQMGLLMSIGVMVIKIL